MTPTVTQKKDPETLLKKLTIKVTQKVTRNCYSKNMIENCDSKNDLQTLIKK